MARRNQAAKTGRLSRRELLVGGAAMAAAGRAAAEGEKGAFSFPLLGDLHFDRLAHHDMEWLQREKPNDVRQVQNYSALTEKVLPRLLPEVREHIAKAGTRVPFVVQVGDLVEGLCGTPEPARRHCEEALAFVKEARLGAPMLFAKGNHDVTGPGSVEAFDQVLLPALREASRKELKSASYTVQQGAALFAFVDAYDRTSLDWLERTLEGRTAKHLFVVIHPPVVPFGARSTWHQFASERQTAQRARLMKVLGRNRAIVLCGHLHKCGVVVRKTDEGAFVQLMVSSIVSNPEAGPKQQLAGKEQYGPDLVRLEPSFQPETEVLRRKVLEDEAPQVRHFEYAEAAGYATVTVDDRGVRAQLYAGIGKPAWKTIELTELLRGA